MSTCTLLLSGILSAALVIPATSALAEVGPTTRPAMHVGADLSLLPTLEQAGAVFRDAAGPADTITIFRRQGCDLFRVRLFVNPNPEFAATGGAIQNLDYAMSLARRIHASGALLLLDLHYSDTWADPAKQTKPAAWANLHGQALQQQVYDYTRQTVRAFVDAGCSPDFVQVGNEITPGMLWPDGKIAYQDPAREDDSWAALGRLLQAAADGIHAAQTADHPISAMIHVDGGGEPARPIYFFQHLTRHFSGFDVIGLSFYPTNGETLAALQANMADLARLYDKDIYVVETAYGWRQTPHPKHPEALRWPQTPQGQRQFIAELAAAIRQVPAGHGRGLLYWYPESVRRPGMWIWQGGSMALFDDQAMALPALSALAGH